VDASHFRISSEPFDSRLSKPSRKDEELKTSSTAPAVRAAIYLRVSTRDKGQETANQLLQLREYCRAVNWMVVQAYADHESGGKMDRPQFQAMMTDAARHKFDVLVFWALDRLTREGALLTLQHLNQLSGYGIGFRSLYVAKIQSAVKCQPGKRSG
jgi:DNA invertase Pin-like site-specific DNA recombinase